MSFHRSESNLVVRGSFYLMLLLAFAMVFLPFQPTQQAEAGVVLVVVVVIVILLATAQDAHGDSSSCLPLVPEFIAIVEEEAFCLEAKENG